MTKKDFIIDLNATRYLLLTSISEIPYGSKYDKRLRKISKELDDIIQEIMDGEVVK